MTNLTFFEQSASLAKIFPEAARITYECGSWNVTTIDEFEEVTELYSYIPGTKKFRYFGVITVEV